MKKNDIAVNSDLSSPFKPIKRPQKNLSIPNHDPTVIHQ